MVLYYIMGLGFLRNKILWRVKLQVEDILKQNAQVMCQNHVNKFITHYIAITHWKQIETTKSSNLIDFFYCPKLMEEHV
jgi:hypothetical protein